MKCWRKKKLKEKERKWFLENGSIFLQQLIADCNGLSNPIRMFSSDQISKATDHFDPKFYLHDIPEAFTWYKAVIEGRSYVIKRFTDIWHQIHPAAPYNDIALSSRVSNYSGFLKLMGCCLDFPCPVLVFENQLEYSFLNVRGSIGCEDEPLLPWNVRLKIAKAIARAIAYLHTAFPRIIVHRNISPGTVLLDKNGTAKLTGLSKAVTLPEGKTWTEEEHVFGTYGYMDPIYLLTDRLTEYSDVFSFGIFMLVLLMGKPSYWVESDVGSDTEILLLDYVRDLHERGEPIEFGGGLKEMRPGQMKMFLNLALRCCEERNEDRPKMISVAKEIKLIETRIT